RPRLLAFAVASLSLLRHPPSPTLSPYTTLFRSLPAPAPGCPRGGRPRADAVPAPGPELGITETARAAAASGQHRRCRGFPVLAPDRKSTRLNSSYVKISYAVFCLKKKSDNID